MSYRYGDVVAPYVAVNEPLTVEDQHFVDCVLTGTRPRTDGENGLAVVETLAAAELSLREGRPVRVEEVRTRRPALTAAGAAQGDVRLGVPEGGPVTVLPPRAGVLPAQRTVTSGAVQ
jgi:hypothetical protein